MYNFSAHQIYLYIYKVNKSVISKTAPISGDVAELSFKGRLIFNLEEIILVGLLVCQAK